MKVFFLHYFSFNIVHKKENIYVHIDLFIYSGVYKSHIGKAMQIFYRKNVEILFGIAECNT